MLFADYMAAIRRKLRKATGFDAAFWRTLAEAYLWVTTAWLGLRLVGYLRLKTALADARVGRVRPYDRSELGELAEAVDVAARNHLLSITCLPRSLALCRLARARGFPAEIQFGVARRGAGFRAHAWVEVDGHIVGDRQDVDIEFARLEGIVGDGTER
jgi:hypothetical protein